MSRSKTSAPFRKRGVGGKHGGETKAVRLNVSYSPRKALELQEAA